MKNRLDHILVSLHLAPSGEKARELIKSGHVLVDGSVQDKPGRLFEEEGIALTVTEEMPYVSRGGRKLEKALDVWKISLEGKTCMDIGASTGGFTDCMLQHGAARVYAIDVGYGQLAECLRADARVVNMEKTNFRYLAKAAIADCVDFAGADVSFISLSRILLPAWKLLGAEGQMVCLIKPQFEAGQKDVGSKGVVRDREVHKKVIGRVMDYADLLGFTILDLEYSPIRGPEGNIEYLLHLLKDGERQWAEEWTEEQALEGLVQKDQDGACGISRKAPWSVRIGEVVTSAHSKLA